MNIFSPSNLLFPIGSGKVMEIIFIMLFWIYLCFVKNVILLITLAIMLVKPFWPVMDYMVNYDYIVNTLCENKDKPEMHCNGKCYLTKELAKTSENDSQNPTDGKISKTEIPQVLFSENITEFNFSIETEFFPTEKVGYLPVLFSSLFVSKIIHPPILG